MTLLQSDARTDPPLVGLRSYHGSMRVMAITDKISITIGRGELRDARRLSARLGLSLSTFISHAVRDRVAEQVRREAAQAVLAGFPAEDRATPAEMAALLARWAEPAPRARRAPGQRAQRARR